MKLIEIDHTNKKQFIKFYKNQYLNKELIRDSMSNLLLGLLNGTSVMCKSVDLNPIMVIDNNKIIMVCILAFAYRMPEFLQISFFEASENNSKAFQLILDRANILAKEKGASKISGSLNIHVNYGLGFLASDYQKWQSFGTPHNPPFYNNFFNDTDFETIDMVSFQKDMDTMDSLFNQSLKDRLEKRYSVRPVNFKDLENEASIYTQINNEAFSKHLFYYPREADEDLELFKEFKFLLRPENLLFVEKDNIPVGFMLWYPDYHMLMNPNDSVGIKMVIKNKLFSKRMDTFKIVEIGVIPSEQYKGAILALFNYCFQCTKGKYNKFESGWVLAGNDKSLSFGFKWSDGIHKKYKAYIKDVQ